MKMLLPAFALVGAGAGGDAPRYAFTVAPSHQLVEGVAVGGGNIFVSSVIDRQIIAYPRGGGAGRVIRLPAAALHPLGIAWDSQREWLWLAGQCPKEIPAIKPCAKGALTAIDRKGRFKASLTVGGSFQPGDVSVRDGVVFVSDSRNGAVYRVDAKLNSLSTIIPPQAKGSAQGSVLLGGGKQLLVADYSQGVGLVDLATSTRKILLRENGKPLRGIDGLAQVGGRIFAVYNGEAPGALLELTISGDKLAFTQVDDKGMFRDATQLAADGDRLLVVADAGWEAASRKDSPPRQLGATVVAFPIGK